MENKKVIVFGNGIEAHFNKKLKNFNNDIKQWIKELNKSTRKRDDLFDQLKNNGQFYINYSYPANWNWNMNSSTNDPSKMASKNQQDTFWKEVEDNNYLTKILKLLEKELVKNINITIEDALKNVGDKFIQLLNKGTSNNREVSSVFKLLKIILGYYIEVVCDHTIQVNNAINIMSSSNNFSNNFNWDILQPLDEYGYDRIYTTNYSNFVNDFIKLWKTKKSFGTYNVKNIHGEYSLQPKNYFERYNNLQINLQKKKSNEWIAADFNNEKIPFNYSLELYGLDIKNDEVTLTEIIELMITERLNFHLKTGTLFKKKSNLNIEIIYNYFGNIKKSIPEIIQNSILMPLCKTLAISNSMQISFVKKENDSFIYTIAQNQAIVLTINFYIILKDVKNHDIFQAMNSLTQNDYQNFFKISI